MSRADGIIHTPLGDEPDGNWYPDDDEMHVPDGFMCDGPCGHFIKDRDDEDVFFLDGLRYCESCYNELDRYPSDDYWNVDNLDNWSYDDQDAYYSDDIGEGD